MSKHDETLFSFVKRGVSKILTLMVCVTSGIIFLGTINSNMEFAVVSGAVAFLSFCSFFGD